MRWPQVVPLFAALVGGCASVQPISGGEQDTEAPTLVHARPPDRSTSFNARAILLEFDERIQLDRVRERMLVSPPLDTAPDVRLAGPARVEIRLNAPLAPNTTYTFNLGESVKDLTEGNIAAGLSYVVSTGHTVDSGMVAGAVTNALTGASEKGMLVGLYSVGDTNAFRRGRPTYMTRTDAEGQFTLSNLPHGRYSVMALRDKNGNYRFDLPNEEIAIHDTPVEVPTDTFASRAVLRAFLPRSARQQVRSYSVLADGALELVFARSVHGVEVRDVWREGGKLTWTIEYMPTGDTVLLWPSDTTLLAAGKYEIRAGGEVIDTVGYRALRKMPFYTGLVARSHEGNAGTTLILRASRPIVAWDTTRIDLHSDTTAIPYQVHRQDDRTLVLDFKAQDGIPLRLQVWPKAVRDLYGGSNDTLRATLGTAVERATGTLQVDIAGLEPMKDYVLQVLEGQQRVLLEAPVSAARPQARWTRLAPGMRTLRLFEDSNANGRWDTGEWAGLVQPERTWHHGEGVNVRAAWEVKVAWSIAGP